MADIDLQLIEQARVGNANAVAALIRDGADPDARNENGDLALRIAAIAGHFNTAACLLIHGANHNVSDKLGRAALDPEVIGINTLHSIRQYYHRYRDEGDNDEVLRTAQMDEWAGQLDRLGATRLRGLLEPDTLRKMQ